MAQPWRYPYNPIFDGVVVNPKIPYTNIPEGSDRYSLKGRCPVCGQQSLLLRDTRQEFDYRRSSPKSWAYAVCCNLNCGTELDVRTNDYFSWPFKPDVDPNFLNQVNQVAMEIMAEAVGSFKDEKDVVAVRLRALAKKLKKELEKYGV
jgi:hypothetical protein